MHWKAQAAEARPMQWYVDHARTVAPGPATRGRKARQHVAAAEAWNIVCMSTAEQLRSMFRSRYLADRLT